MAMTASPLKRWCVWLAASTPSPKGPPPRRGAT